MKTKQQTREQIHNDFAAKMSRRCDCGHFWKDHDAQEGCDLESCDCQKFNDADSSQSNTVGYHQVPIEGGKLIVQGRTVKVQWKDGSVETWNLPDEAQAQSTFREMQERWRIANDSTDDDEDEEFKRALMKSMSEPASKVGTPPNKVLSNDALAAIVKNQANSGYGSSAALKKMVTSDGFPKPVSIKLIEPGIIPYEYMNNGAGAMVYVPKGTLDKMMNDLEKSLVGKPVINEAHRDVAPDDYKNGRADGTVTKVWYDPSDGWYWCEALVWDADTRTNLANDYGVSCEYTALAPWGPAGTHHGIPYDKEVLDGRYKHLAVVSRPRYEGARIMNSQGGNTMLKLLQWIKEKGQDVRNSVDVDAERTSIEVDGKEVSLSNAVAAYKVQEAAKAKAAADAAAAAALSNAKKLSDEDTVTIDGKEVKVIDLKNAMAAQAKNASEEKYEKDHKDGDHKDKALENCPMCNAEDDEKKDKEKKDEDAKNALLMNSQHRNGQHVQPNLACTVCDAIASERLQNAARQREGKLSAPIVPSIEDGIRRGKQMFGKTRTQQEAEAAGK